MEDAMMCMCLDLFSSNTAEEWFDYKCRANALRRMRDRLHPGMAKDLAELERLGY